MNRQPTHEEICAYYRKLGTLSEPDPNPTQAALDIANGLALEHPEVPMPKAPKKPALEKGSAAAKERMAKLRAARGKTPSKAKEPKK